MNSDEKIKRTKELLEKIRKDAARPRCSNCVFYHPVVNGSKYCYQPLVSVMRVNTEGVVTREKIKTVVARQDESLCGMNGDLFIQATPKEKRKKWLQSSGLNALLAVLATLVILSVIGLGAFLVHLFGFMPVVGSLILIAFVWWLVAFCP